MFSPVNPNTKRDTASSPRPLHKLKVVSKEEKKRGKQQRKKEKEELNPAKQGDGGIDTVFTDALSNDKLFR